MTEEPHELRTGRERYQRQAQAVRRRDAVRRVRAYERWLKAGSPPGCCPPIPSNADYRAARGQQ
jgi:hypothetical protein